MRLLYLHLTSDLGSIFRKVSQEQQEQEQQQQQQEQVLNL